MDKTKKLRDEIVRNLKNAYGAESVNFDGYNFSTADVAIKNGNNETELFRMLSSNNPANPLR